MLAAQDVATRCKELGITALHIKIRATGGASYILHWMWELTGQETAPRRPDPVRSRRSARWRVRA
jgi:ribosomal protein S11